MTHKEIKQFKGKLVMINYVNSKGYKIQMTGEIMSLSRTIIIFDINKNGMEKAIDLNKIEKIKVIKSKNK
jgi:hypothetical protein